MVQGSCEERGRGRGARGVGDGVGVLSAAAQDAAQSEGGDSHAPTLRRGNEGTSSIAAGFFHSSGGKRETVDFRAALTPPSAGKQGKPIGFAAAFLRSPRERSPTDGREEATRRRERQRSDGVSPGIALRFAQRYANASAGVESGARRSPRTIVCGHARESRAGRRIRS